jgi:histone H3/H4
MAISRPSARKILKESGPLRVSESAAEELAETINRFAYGVARKAAKLAHHAKRTTVKKEDVELAT